jgi:hypothetical protein
VILFNPLDKDRPFGLNLMTCDTDDPNEVRWMMSTVIGTLERLSGGSWGPRLEHVLRHMLLTSLLIKGATFLELFDFFYITKEEQKELVPILEDPILKRFWGAFPYSPRERYDLTASTINKITPFLTDKMVQNIIGQSENTFEFDEIMDEGKILFVNLSKGDLGEDSSSLMGSVIVNLILMSALKRRSIPEDDRTPFHLIVDEFQNFATEGFAVLQSEARKYGVDVTVAHQYRDQLDLLSKGSTLNVGNLVVFRTTGRDSYDLASQFDNTPLHVDTRVEPIYEYYEFEGQEVLIEARLSTGEGTLYQELELPKRPYNDMEAEMANRLSILPNYQAWCRLIRVPRSRGEKKNPRLVEYQIEGEQMGKGEENPDIARRIRERSHQMAKTREEVEADIKRRIQDTDILTRVRGVKETDETMFAEPRK